MPTKRQAEDWVDALRVFIKDTLGNKNWQIVNKKAVKTSLGVHFDNNSRISKYNLYKCQKVKLFFFFNKVLISPNSE